MQTRRRKCKECREWFKPSMPNQIVCNYKCAKAYGEKKVAIKKVKAEAKKKREIKLAEKKERSELRERKKKLLTLEQLCVKLQKAVNDCIRERDLDKGCISCGRSISDAGHLFHAGSKYRISRLRFHWLNINGQCEECNRFVGGGNHGPYIEGFIYRYGEEKLEELKNFKLWVDQGNEPPLTKDMVIEQTKIFRQFLPLIQQGKYYEPTTLHTSIKTNRC